MFTWLISSAVVTVPGIAGEWVLNTTNLPAAGLRALKSHLLRVSPTILVNQDSTALISGGCLPRQETAKIGTEIPVKV